MSLIDPSQAMFFQTINLLFFFNKSTNLMINLTIPVVGGAVSVFLPVLPTVSDISALKTVAFTSKNL